MTWLLWHAMITLLLKKSAIVKYGIELRVCRVFCRAKTSDQSRPSQTRARSAMKTRHRLYFLHSSYLVRRLSATSCIFYWQAKTLHIYNQESMQIKAWYIHIVRIEKKNFLMSLSSWKFFMYYHWGFRLWKLLLHLPPLDR